MCAVYTHIDPPSQWNLDVKHEHRYLNEDGPRQQGSNPHNSSLHPYEQYGEQDP